MEILSEKDRINDHILTEAKEICQEKTISD